MAEVRSGSPAEDAGLAVGDVITSVEGKAVATPQELQGAVDASRPGETIIVDYLRDGASRTVAVTLGTRPA